MRLPQLQHPWILAIGLLVLALLVWGFWPRPVLVDQQDLEDWLAAGEPELSVADRVTAESVLLYLMMRNPATRPFRELFDDGELQRQASYVPFVVSLEEYMDRQEPSSLTGKTIFHTLRAPILASPDDLAGQLAYIREHWAALLPEDMLARLDLARDILKEMSLARAPEYGPPPVLEFEGADWLFAEPAAFSRDADWMSNVVLLAKSTYVWLDQLSQRYGRRISTLDLVPDDELDRLGRWGFTGLWLIGVWERSRASERIKRWMGDEEAVASAYSLADYRIANERFTAWLPELTRLIETDLAELETLRLLGHGRDELDEGLQGGTRRGEGVGRADRAVGLDVDHQAVVVRRLLDAGGLDLERHATDRAEDRVDRDQADGRVFGLVLVGGDIAFAGVDRQFHEQVRAFVEVADDVLLVEHLDACGLGDIGGGDDTGPFGGNRQALRPFDFHADRDALEVQDDVGDVLADTGDRGELVQHVVDLDGSDGRALERRHQHAAQRVAEGETEATLQRLQRHSGTVRTQFLNVDMTGGQKLCCGVCHVSTSP